jgi:hypothetical protein
MPSVSLTGKAKSPRRQSKIKDENYAQNKAAFDAILHQDESTPEYEDKTARGVYHSFRSCSDVKALDYSKMGGGGVVSGAQTFPNDLCITVENIVAKKIKDKKDLKMVTDWCMMGLTDSSDYTPRERKRMVFLEQKLGRAFVQAGLFPVKKFFTCIRKNRKNK